MTHIVVVGAGQAGSSLCAKLRSSGFDGQITLVGEEPVPPYQRPPLSKKYLLGEMALERLYLRPAQFYEDEGITLRLGQAVTSIDRDAKTLTLGSDVLTYDHLAFTTGSSPRRLPAAIGGDLPGVFVVRDLKDVDGMAPDFVLGRHVLVVGGGYIGLEAAAVAAAKGLKVTVVEAAPRILQRVACEETSAYFRALHRAHDVRILENVGLERLLGEDHVTGARLSDGSEIAVDFVIAGIGILPNDTLAQQAGLDVDAGIKVNLRGHTDDHHVWAAGDCARFPYRGEIIRLESVQNAIDQAECVAENMMGAARDYVPKPWFWSDQYDVKLQIAGLNMGYTDVVARVGDRDGSQSVWYYRGDTLLAVDAMNDPRNYMIGKRLIEAGKSPAPDAIADPATDMKALLQA
ncbi:UNVERIFIED_CONTAM: hypothetical protein GTU68_018419 [Idotea baltica]|nr:hypothetical protein [Idotea baltica]